jgi:hypothetical protein
MGLPLRSLVLLLVTDFLNNKVKGTKEDVFL